MSHEHLQNAFEAAYNGEEEPRQTTPLKMLPLKEPPRIKRETVFASLHLNIEDVTDVTNQHAILQFNSLSDQELSIHQESSNTTSTSIKKKSQTKTKKRIADFCKSAIEKLLKRKSAIDDLTVLERRKRALIKLMNDLTKPIPQGGYNTERIYVQDKIQAIEKRIKHVQVRFSKLRADL